MEVHEERRVMPKKKGPMLFKRFEIEHRASLVKLRLLHAALERLRAEGKLHRRRNAAAVGAALAGIERESNRHMRLEEKVIFPFVGTHIPRLEPMIYFLRSEHAQFRRETRALGSILRRLQSLGNEPARLAPFIHDVYLKGLCFVSLLRSHMLIESKNLYAAAESELRADEKKMLLRLVRSSLSAWGQTPV